MIRKEIVWIDWVKMICMLLVYWDHIMLYGNQNAPFIIPFRPFFVNAFFFISGYLIFRKQLSSDYIQLSPLSFLKNGFGKYGMVMNIIYKIAIPTIIFSILDFVPACVVKGDPMTLKSLLLDVFIEGGNWFTCALTISEIIIFVLLLTRIRCITFYVITGLILAIIGVYLNNANILILGNEYSPWYYKSGIIACAFLTLGGLYQKYEKIFDKYLVVTLIVFILISINNDLDRVPMSTWAGMNFVGFIISTISIFAVIYICKPLSQIKYVKYISRHTLGFYFLSAASPFICIRICNLFMPQGSFSFYIQFILSFITSWIIVFLLEKYIPAIFDLRLLSKSNKK